MLEQSSLVAWLIHFYLSLCWIIELDSCSTTRLGTSFQKEFYARKCRNEMTLERLNMQRVESELNLHIEID